MNFLPLITKSSTNFKDSSERNHQHAVFFSPCQFRLLLSLSLSLSLSTLRSTRLTVEKLHRAETLGACCRCPLSVGFKLGLGSAMAIALKWDVAYEFALLLPYPFVTLKFKA